MDTSQPPLKQLVIDRTNRLEKPLKSTDSSAYLLRPYATQALNPTWPDTSERLSELLNKYQTFAPSDLKLNVQRINLRLRQNQGRATYGAILDLLTTLNGGGADLAKRMLLKSAPLLQKNQIDFLNAYLCGKARLEQAPFCSDSLLACTSGKSTPLVKKSAPNSSQDQDSDQNIIALYQGYMEAGDLDAAKHCLIEHICNGSTDKQAHAELTDLMTQLNELTELKDIKQTIFKRLEQHPELMNIWHAI
jgi:hypothetical protein